jgi:hypothetical protein
MGAMPPVTDGSQVMRLGVAVVEVAGGRADSRRTDGNGRGVVWVGGVAVGDVAGATLGNDAPLLRVRPQRLGKGATTLGGGVGVGAGLGTTLGSGGGVSSGDGVGSTVGGGGGDGVWGGVVRAGVGTWEGR